MLHQHVMTGKVCHVSFRRFDNSMGNQKQVSSAAHSQQNVTGKSEETRKTSLHIFATGLDGPLTSLNYPSLMSVCGNLTITLLIPNSVQVYRLKQGLQQSIPIESSYTKIRHDVLRRTNEPSDVQISFQMIHPSTHPSNHHQSSSIIINHHQSSILYIYYHLITPD